MEDWNSKNQASEDLGAVLIAFEASPKGYNIESLFCIITPVYAIDSTSTELYFSKL